MLTVADLSHRDLVARLAGNGLFLRTGPFTSCIRSNISYLIDGVAQMYGAYPVDDSGFADFHLQLRRPGGLRRWFHPQVRFDHDGLSPFEPLPVNHAFPMLEWMLNYCVSSQAHGYLIIHAAVVEKNGHAVILPAPPGSGKSTLCAALVSRGWRLLSDELTLIGLDDQQLTPLPRPVSLKNASIPIMKAYAPAAAFTRSAMDTAKGTVAHLKAPDASVARAAETARAAWVVFPKYQADADVTVSPIAPARAFMRVAENAFNYSLTGERGFHALGKVIETCTSFDFTYSKLDEAIAFFDALRVAPR
ncbi:HprK-related kinase A [Massilia sp. S19_KUP03_FR1]|uniref:HprK-related kinase A n=1 Tax=Massilia sp. S19_KUP03_FR1 TaxID=3025503 RepID=UPI002FCD8E9C